MTSTVSTALSSFHRHRPAHGIMWSYAHLISSPIIWTVAESSIYAEEVEQSRWEDGDRGGKRKALIMPWHCSFGRPLLTNKRHCKAGGPCDIHILWTLLHAGLCVLVAARAHSNAHPDIRVDTSWIIHIPSGQSISPKFTSATSQVGWKRERRNDQGRIQTHIFPTQTLQTAWCTRPSMSTLMLS